MGLAVSTALLASPLSRQRCVCKWAQRPGACNHDDGSPCWTFCCKPLDGRRHNDTPAVSLGGRPTNFTPSKGASDQVHMLQGAKPCGASCGPAKAVLLTAREMRELEVSLCPLKVERHTELSMGDVCRTTSNEFRGCPRGCAKVSRAPWCILAGTAAEEAFEEPCRLSRAAHRFAKSRGFTLETPQTLLKAEAERKDEVELHALATARAEAIRRDRSELGV